MQRVSAQRVENRFIPYVAVHEFEALLFSDPVHLAETLKIKQNEIEAVLNKFGNPESINNSPATAPSKRLEKFFPRYKKVQSGIAIAEKIGIDKIRKKCKLFNNWISQLEELRQANP